MQLSVPLNIYSKPWLIEPNAAMQLLDCWEQIRAGAGEWKPESKKPSSVNSNGVMYAPTTSWDMKDFKGFEGSSVAVIPIMGPLMKQDYCGSLGTSSIISLIKMANDTPSVKSIIFDTDSPGGTVDGTQALSNAIKSSPKRTITAVSGLMCSAAFWAGSSSNEVWATSDTDMIGSIGTMMSLIDSSKAREKQGVVTREYFADASKDKNKDFADARNGDGKALIQNMLNPMNDVFLGAVKANRPIVSEDALTGKVYTSSSAKEMGLIDGVKAMDDIFNSAISSTHTTSFWQKTDKNLKSIKMDINQFKAEHPDTYKAVLAEERDRTMAFLQFVDADPKAAVEGVKSGEKMTQSQMVELTRKSFYKEMKNGVEQESENTPAKSAASPVETINPEKAKSEQELRLDSMAAKIDKALGSK